jgi:hypothetical protein
MVLENSSNFIAMFFLRALCITIVESFRGLRKLSGGPWLSKRGFARAKTPKTPSPEV